MDELKDIVSQVIGNMSIKQPETHCKIEQLWRNILNTKELEHTCISGIKDSFLSVNVDSPAWMYKLKMKKYKILRRLKEEDVGIKAIIFKIGKV